AVVSQNALPALRTDKQFQGFIDDLPFGFETRELSGLAHQTLVNVNVGSHGVTIHHSWIFLCITLRHNTFCIGGGNDSESRMDLRVVRSKLESCRRKYFG